MNRRKFILSVASAVTSVGVLGSTVLGETYDPPITATEIRNSLYYWQIEMSKSYRGANYTNLFEGV